MFVAPSSFASSHLLITGSIFERDIEWWVSSLEVALPVEVEEQGDRISIRPRVSPPRARSSGIAAYIYM